ncbi:hypothetical protein M408DRAFT_329535 [Serendipita vermifera MAFF 305830]|uniref:Pex19-domain-containing protein n=1 Tax=Serendipita vermifera MAFF 305830 TaxID=933852 RepID=A0A0C3AUC5_SERVB|nr:hypothetical protein M408DRAFT_329535 [Serendipita vermifera MAFF 305830]
MASGKKVAIEDDVDDLDDVLEQFNAPAASTSKPAPQAKSKDVAEKEEPGDEEDFAKQFAAEMEAFMKGLVDPSANSGEPVDPEAAKQAEALRKAWEQLLVEDLEGADDEAMEPAADSKPKAAKAAESSKDGASKTEDEFQKAVKQAMEKLKESDDSSKAEAAEGDLSSLLSAFSGMNFDAEGGKDVQGVLESLMGQLMSKEILYEPLKELHQKFPGYLEANRAIIPTEDEVRYDKQYSIVGQVIKIFEAPDYSDDNPATMTEIVSLMSEMQEYGSPPAEIMGALPPGFDMGSDGLQPNGDNCIIV